MSDTSLSARVASFDERHYRFVDFCKLGEFPEPERSAEKAARDALNAHRHTLRYEYFFEPLLGLFGGSLKGHRVLDLGCNAGYWSLKSAQAGADFIFGLDGREIHVDHANLVFEAEGISSDRYRFEVGNLFEYPFPADSYDIVLCLGLMYHVAKPVELFEVMSRAGAETIVIDTEVTLTPGSMFQLYTEALSARTNAVDYETVFYPTRQAVIDLARQFGYQCVPLALNMKDWVNVDNYRDHRRVAFISARETPLDSLAREVPPLVTRAGVLGEAARLGHRFRSAANALRRGRPTRLSNTQRLGL
jgi:SAM-dependent methyltransferase